MSACNGHHQPEVGTTAIMLWLLMAASWIPVFLIAYLFLPRNLDDGIAFGIVFLAWGSLWALLAIPLIPYVRRIGPFNDDYSSIKIVLLGTSFISGLIAFTNIGEEESIAEICAFIFQTLTVPAFGVMVALLFIARQPIRREYLIGLSLTAVEYVYIVYRCFATF